MWVVCFGLICEKPSCNSAFSVLLMILLCFVLFRFVFKHAWKAHVEETAKYDSLASFVSDFPSAAFI